MMILHTSLPDVFIPFLLLETAVLSVISASVIDRRGQGAGGL